MMTPTTNSTPAPVAPRDPITDLNQVRIAFRGHELPAELRSQVLGAMVTLKCLSECAMYVVEDDGSARPVSFDDLHAPALGHCLAYVRLDNLVALGATLARIASS